MNKLIISGIASAILWLTMSHSLPETHPVTLKYPESWPAPVYDFGNNPLTREGIALGRQLFYDPILSKDNSISCSSCHLSYTAFTHVDHALSHGIGDSIGTRNSPTLINLAWSKYFMWDGAVHHLDMQALAPITHPKEMGEDLTNVVGKLQRSATYPKLFFEAFGDSLITGERLLKALAQFELVLVSDNSIYDKVKRGERVFTEQEEKGYVIFKKYCNACHTEPLFTNGAFANNGLPADTLLNDPGRMGISQNPEDSMKFKVPTLRNIGYSFPYMHDGRFKKLREVIHHYTSGIVHSKTLEPVLQNGIALSPDEKVDLTAFLLTLNDESFVFNADFAPYRPK